MPPQSRPVGRLWRRSQLGVPKGPRKQNGRPEGSYRLPVLVPLLVEERPTQAPEGGEGRRLWCRRTNRCVEFASAKGWTGFTCAKCPVHENETPRSTTERKGE